MSIFKKTLSCAVLAALGTCALAGCGRQNTSNEAAASASPEASAAITETVSESTAASKQTPAPDAPEIQSTKPADVTSTPFEQHGALHVENGKLTDADGNTVQLYGMSTHGIAWFPQYINYDSFRTLRDDWNTNCIRLAMYTAEYGGYCAGGDKEQLKQLVRDGVSYATELGMYVIVDWHILSDGNPQQNQKEALKFFKKMAKKYKNNTNVIYEICNEPNGGTSWSTIKKYAEKIIKGIRTYDKKAVILVGTPNWSQDVDQAALSPVSKKYRKNVMYTLHFYAATHKEWLRDKAQAALDKGLPLFVSEFSICDASGNGGLDKAEAKKWLTFLDKNNISYMAWSLSNKAESSAFIKSGCSNTGKWSSKNLTAAGKWITNWYKKK